MKKFKNSLDPKKRLIFYLYMFLFTAACIFGVVYYIGDNSFTSGSSIYYPADGDTLSSEIQVTGHLYAKTGIESFQLVFENEKDSFVFDLDFIKVYDDGEVITTTTSFKENIVIPVDGDYNMMVKAIKTDGSTQIFDKGIISVKDGVKTNIFEMFGIQHIAGSGFMILLGIILLLIYKYNKTEKTGRTLFALAAFTLIYCDIAFRVFLALTGNFKVSYHLGLHMCDVSSVLIVYALLVKKGKLTETVYNVCFFWGVAGAFMALMTPDMIGYSFPSYFYFSFFAKHGMLVIAVLLLTYIGDYRPTFRMFPKVVLITLVMAFIIYFINLSLVFLPPYEIGNYMFLSYPPLDGSPIDLLVDIFGPSPYYIIGLVFLGGFIYAFFILLFKLPTILKRKNKQIIL